MRVTRIVLGESAKDTQVVMDDSYVLDGVKDVTIHQGQDESYALLKIPFKEIEIEQLA